MKKKTKRCIDSSYLNHILMDDPCNGCAAYEEIGHCGTWAGKCHVRMDSDFAMQVMDFMGWNPQEFYNAAKYVERLRYREKKLEAISLCEEVESKVQKFYWELGLDNLFNYAQRAYDLYMWFEEHKALYSHTPIYHRIEALSGDLNEAYYGLKEEYRGTEGPEPDWEEEYWLECLTEEEAFFQLIQAIIDEFGENFNDIDNKRV